MKTLVTIVLTLLIAGVIAIGIAWSGAVSVGADQPHAALTAKLLQTARQKAVARGARDVTVPADLGDAQVIAAGAGEYAEMCTGCHLAPGMTESEMRTGLNPQPPDFSSAARGTPGEQFWIVKHGVRMTGMPAWGLTHDDKRLWSLVAFLQKLPGMSEADYRALTAAGEGGHHHHDGDAGEESGEESPEHEHGHEHEAADQHEHEHADEPAGSPTATALHGASAEAAAVVDDFQHRLHHGDVKGAAQLLAPSLLVFESGSAERSRAAYASHHLGADAEFLKTATVKPVSRTGGANGNIAWIATESEIVAAGAKPHDLFTTETMVLEKAAPGWRIAHIHWSSHEKK